MPLDVQVQGSFAGGMFRTPSRELIPANGAYDVLNGLLEEDGTVVRRGGSTLKATAGDAITFLWDGYLTGGARTVYGRGTGINTYLSVLDANDTSSTSTFIGLTMSPLRMAAGNGTLAMIISTGAVLLYCGSRSTIGYSTGTFTTTVDSASVTGAGTAWVANAVPGDMIYSSTGVYVGTVLSVQSDTALTLAAPAVVAFTAALYSLGPKVELNLAGDGDISAVASVGNPARLCYGIGSRVYFSRSGYFGVTDPTDYHEIPQGGQVLGMESLRNVLFVFTTSGVFAISNMDYDLTDAQGNVQHRMEQINRDLILWDQRGIAGARGALIVPGVDDVYLVSDSAAPQSISAPISTLYRNYVAAGYQCGGATVFRDHYFLPILNGTTWVDTLVCRLDGGGWTRWAGDGGTSGWMAVRGSSGTARAPQLLSAYSTRIQNLTRCFSPSASNKNDADGTTHVFQIITRDYTTGGMRKNLVKKVRLGYELVDAATDNPALVGSYATAIAPTFVGLTGTADEGGTDVRLSHTFLVGTARGRFVRFQFGSSAPAARMAVRSLEVFSRLEGNQ